MFIIVSTNILIKLGLNVPKKKRYIRFRNQTWVTSYELYFTTNLFRMTRRVLPDSSGEFK
jgi:hypothetical protein